MFGLVRRSRLLEAEKQKLAVRVELLRSEERVIELRRELSAEKRLREAAEKEATRLSEILTAHPVEPSEPTPERPPADAEDHPLPRVLTGLEVVTRATAHRNLHQKATR